jgi:hypothetical protein
VAARRIACSAHFEHLSVGGRLAGCHATFATDVLRACSNIYGGEVWAAHAWDVPVVSVDLGLTLGGWLMEQTFTTGGPLPVCAAALHSKP